MTTLEKLDHITSPPLISSAEDSHVKTSAMPGKAPDYQESVLVCGEKCYEPFAWYDHASHLWRTWQLCLDGGWAEFSETWPRAGMTRSGIAYQLLPLVPDTFASACSSLRPPEFWQTLRSSTRGIWADYRQRSNGGEDFESQIAKQGGSGPMNPEWAEGHMGFPVGWTDLDASATQSSHKSQSGWGIV